MIQKYSNIKILLVEDEAQFLDSMSYSLRRSGFAVYTATTCNNAIEIISECKLKKDPVDLLITDIQLNEGKNGEELIQHVKSSGDKIKILIITGYSDEELMRCLLKTGCSEFLKKPFTNKIFIQKIHNLLKQNNNKNKKIFSVKNKLSARQK